MDSLLISDTPDSSLPLHDIRAVCRLAGLSAGSLRAWEQRYQVVTPRRSPSGRRQYSDNHIRRLIMLKSLSEEGHPIGSIAALSDEQLRVRLASGSGNHSLRADDQQAVMAKDLPRLAVVGTRLDASLTQTGPLWDQQIVIRGVTLDEVEMQDKLVPADLLLIECPALFGDLVVRVQRLARRIGAQRTLIFYQFAPARLVASLTDLWKGMAFIRMPINAAEIQRLCLDSFHGRAVKATTECPPLDAGIPPRRFTDAQLAHLAEIHSAVDCECPQHLSTLVFSLIAFEAYSAQCEARNQKDAAVHSYLHQMTAQARATMETALLEVLRHENIILEAVETQCGD